MALFWHMGFWILSNIQQCTNQTLGNIRIQKYEFDPWTSLEKATAKMFLVLNINDFFLWNDFRLQSLMLRQRKNESSKVGSKVDQKQRPWRVLVQDTAFLKLDLS